MLVPPTGLQSMLTAQGLDELYEIVVEITLFGVNLIQLFMSYSRDRSSTCSYTTIQESTLFRFIQKKLYSEASQATNLGINVVVNNPQQGEVLDGVKENTIRNCTGMKWVIT